MLKHAMNISLAVGVVMLVAKWIAWMLTGSSVIFSDAAESVVHIVAVWFAWYALRMTLRPPDSDHHYGHQKMGLISAAVEGGLICIAGIVIIFTSVQRMFTGIQLEKLDVGIAITAGAGMVNALLGFFLVHTGKKNHSLVVEANGKHVLTDAWTSAGAVLGLFLASVTGWYILDPLLAIVFGENIMREGIKLVSMSVTGLMDSADPVIEQQARQALSEFVRQHNITFHEFRLRSFGNQASADFHLLFPDTTPIWQAHKLATEAEHIVRKAIGLEQVDVISHLEPQSHPADHP